MNMAKPGIKKIIVAGVLVGTLDILAACLQYYLQTGNGPGPVLRYIAGGLHGPAAFRGGMLMQLTGLLIHYGIAMGFTFVFSGIARAWPAIGRYRFITGLGYGIAIWAAMHFLVLPLTRLPAPVFNPEKAAVAAGILVACIGLPLAYLLTSPPSKTQAR